jgi:hypothetical protein
MWPFSKKQPKEHKCEHKYKDFPWYVESTTYGNGFASFSITIKEPYVCMKCGDRIDKTLWSYRSQSNYKNGQKLFQEKMNSIIETYKDKIKDRAVIEDMINDMILVDRDYVEAYNKIIKT